MRIKLRIDLRAWCNDHDTNLHALSIKAGLSPKSVYDLADGKVAPGERSIAGLIHATGLGFRTLFEVVEK